MFLDFARIFVWYFESWSRASPGMVERVRKQDGIDKLEAEQSQVLEDTTIILLEHGVTRF